MDDFRDAFDDVDQFTTDLISSAWKLYRQEIESRCPDDYEVYIPNMTKLMNTYAFLTQLASEHGGRVDDLKFDKREINGGITAYFTILYLVGDDLVRFCDLIKNARALSIDSLVDGSVCISITFSDVFKKIR